MIALHFAYLHSLNDCLRSLAPGRGSDVGPLGWDWLEDLEQLAVTDEG